MFYKVFQIQKNLLTFSNLTLILCLVSQISSEKYHQKSTSNKKKPFNETYEHSFVQHQNQNQCGSCKNMDDIKLRTLEMIKKNVLRKLGYQTAPNVTGKSYPEVPQAILEKYSRNIEEMQSDQPAYHPGISNFEEVDEDYVKPQSVVTYAKPYPRLRHSWKGHDIMHFTFSESITKYRVKNASMYVFIKGADSRPLPDILIEIYKVYKSPDHVDSPGLQKVVAKKITQPLGHGEWIKIDFTTTVSEWFKNNRENLGFVLNMSSGGKKLGMVTSESGSLKMPYVEISTMEGKKRTRRNAGLNCDETTNQPICCRYPLTVNFEAFEWDFIIAPKSYEAFYCNGDCPPVTLQKHPHTHLINLASSNSVQPCCAPRKMSSLSMLYFDKDLSVVYGKLPGMIVDRCGCS